VQTYSAFYQHELSKLILEEVERRKEQLVTASATFDFPAYRHHVGIIEGLRTALELCDEAESIAHNYFVMQRNHYQGLEEGAKRMAYWLMKHFKQQNNENRN
jgi:hypothetical protein